MLARAKAQEHRVLACLEGRSASSRVTSKSTGKEAKTRWGDGAAADFWRKHQPSSVLGLSPCAVESSMSCKGEGRIDEASSAE